MAKRRELEQTSFLYGGNSSFIEELYARYLTDPAAVDPSWRAYFDELEPENRALFERARAALEPQAGAICGWSSRPAAPRQPAAGDRRSADQGADPRSSARDHADPRLSRARPPDRQARSAGPHPQRAAPRARLPHLRLHRRRSRPRVLPRLRAGPGEGHACARSWRCCSKTYSGTVGIEFMHIQDPEQKAWIQARIEGTAGLFTPRPRRSARSSSTSPRPRASSSSCTSSSRAPSASASTAARAPSRRWRRSSAPPPSSAARRSCIGMPHRGRLNVLANVMGKPYAAILSEFQGERRHRRGAGLGRRQVPSGHLDRPGAARRPHDPPVAHRQPLASRGGQPGGHGQGARQADGRRATPSAPGSWRS